jgi:hypothetical protein
MCYLCTLIHDNVTCFCKSDDDHMDEMCRQNNHINVTI